MADTPLTHTVYSNKGKQSTTVTLPEDIFGLPFNRDLVYQVVSSLRANKRTRGAHTKDRSEVKATGKKPWPQKGTGNARHGSRVSNIWIGGGVSHGPRNERNFEKKINRKVKAKALFTALSKKLADSQLLFTERLSFTEPKTKEAYQIAKAFSSVEGFETVTTENPVNMLVVLPARDETVEKSFRNLPFAETSDIHNLTVEDVMRFRYVIFAGTDDIVSYLQEKQQSIFANSKVNETVTQ